MRILITGGAGFIGSHLAEKLLQQNHAVTILDHHLNKKRENISFLKSADIIAGDIRNQHLLEKIISKNDIVFHFAGKITVANSSMHKNEFYTTNVLATKNLLGAAYKGKIKKVFFASSAAVYGNATHFPISETTPLTPISYLGQTKKEAEEICHYYQNKGLDVTIFRFFNAYGPRQNIHHGNIIRLFIQNILEDKKVTILGDGNQTRDFIYVDDIVRTCIVSLSKRSSKIVNIGTGIETKIKDVISLFEKITKKKIFYQNKPPRDEDIYRSVANIHELLKLMDRKKLTLLSTGLKKTIMYYQ